MSASKFLKKSIQIFILTILGFICQLGVVDGSTLLPASGLSSPVVNMIIDPEFELKKAGLGDGHVADSQTSGLSHWTRGNGVIYDAKFMVENFAGNERALGIEAGYDRQGMWRTKIPRCEPGARYRFEGEFYRYDRSDATSYPEVRIWGNRFRLNTHRMVGRFQRLYVEMDCPVGVTEKQREFVFQNSHPGTSFWMRKPVLFQLSETGKRSYATIPEERFYPIGVFGATADTLEEVQRSGVNSVIIALDKKNVQACLEANIHCNLAVVRAADQLQEKLEELAPLLRQGDFSFYVNDEPGIHSFPVAKAKEIQKILKRKFPDIPTSMAIVRPHVIPDYWESADYFMLDQYPVPNMPMTWLSDSMDVAAGYVGRGRLQAVIQAFGGEKYQASGWPRLPSFSEMNCLAYLSVVHGSRGIYFYSYRDISSSEEGKADLVHLVRRLNSLKSWLLIPNRENQTPVNMVSDYKYDPRGLPAVHCAEKEQYNTRMLICVNTIRTYTEAEVDVAASHSRLWRDYYSTDSSYLVNGNLFIRFDPLEVKVLLEVK